jgi:serine phosphatase RsbU (regulator of sigma subunit)
VSGSGCKSPGRLGLGVQLPGATHPEITLMSQGDILFLYTDGVYDGSDNEERKQLEVVMRKHCLLPAKDICRGFLEYALQKDDHLRQIGEQDRIDDKTVFIIKRN